MKRHSLLQSCALTQRFRSSLWRVLPCFLMLLPQPAVIVPSLEKARFTIGDEGTLLGLNTWEPVSHRNGRDGTSGYGIKSKLFFFNLDRNISGLIIVLRTKFFKGTRKSKYAKQNKFSITDKNGSQIITRRTRHLYSFRQ